jgi:F-type H+-transporting ATPase subunit delta
MSDTSTIARPYAQALFDIAVAENALTAYSEALSILAQLVATTEAGAFLTRPDLGAQARTDFVTSVGSEAGAGDFVGSSQGQNLIRLLVENDRLLALPDISRRFDALKAEAENVVKVTLVTATEADADVTNRIAEKLEGKLGRKVELDLEVDNEILGGAVVRAEDRVIDGSVKTRLKQLAESLVG